MSLEKEKKRISDRIKQVLGGQGYLSQKEIIKLVGHGDEAIESERGSRSKSKKPKTGTDKERVVLGNRRLITEVIRNMIEKGVIKRRTTYSMK